MFNFRVDNHKKKEIKEKRRELAINILLLCKCKYSGVINVRNQLVASAQMNFNFGFLAFCFFFELCRTFLNLY